MSESRTIKINEVEYVRKDDIKSLVVSGPIKIVVVNQGFVYIGTMLDRSDMKNEEDYNLGICVSLCNAYNIRVWGTTKGLGELVNGPTKTTRLDKVGSIQIPLHAVVSVIDVNQASWKL